MSDLLIAKQQSVELSIRRARDTWGKESDLPFEKDYDKQDIIIFNLQRACEQTLDIANHMIRIKKLGWPRDTADSFRLLGKAGIINTELEKKLIGMVGFRNIVIHEYQKIDYHLVEDVIKKHADDLITFAGIMLASSQ